MSESFNFNYNFILLTPKKVLWKLANAFVAANECSKSLGLKYFVPTPMFHCCNSCTFSLSKPVHLGGGGYLSTVCGTGTCHFLGVLFSNHYGIMGIIFTVF